MNNRIQELLELTGVTYSVMPRDTVYEKLGELIIKECIEIVENAVDHREPASTYADKILEHFGIETVNDTIRRRSTYFGNNP